MLNRMSLLWNKRDSVLVYGVVFLVLGYGAFWTSLCHAQGLGLKTTKGIYYEGAQFFMNKNYQNAAVRFEIAYKLLPKEPKYDKARTKLSYYLGVSYYHLKKWRKADKHLGLYKAAPLDPKKEAEVKRLHAEVQKIVATLPPPRRAIRKPPPVPPKKRVRVAPILVTSVGILTVLGGVISGTMVSSRIQERDTRYQELATQASPQSSDIAKLQRQAETLALTSNALYIAGGTITATGLILMLSLGTSYWEKPPPPKKIKALSRTSSSMTAAMKKISPATEQIHVAY